jgi:hypothetical protein
MNEELWETIVIVHNTNKSLFIWCEENGVELKSFLQPNNELKNAWEHAIRAKANEMGLTGEPNADYIQKNLHKVLSHEYRAFFDICDWLSVNLRQWIIKTLKPYDNETINAAIPNYYTEIRPKAERFCNEIAELRSTKDIPLREDIIAHVEKYRTVISHLIGERAVISSKIGGLEEYKAKKQKDEVKSLRKERSLVIIGAIIGGAALVLFEMLKSKLFPEP